MGRGFPGLAEVGRDGDGKRALAERAQAKAAGRGRKDQTAERSPAIQRCAVCEGPTKRMVPVWRERQIERGKPRPRGEFGKRHDHGKHSALRGERKGGSDRGSGAGGHSCDIVRSGLKVLKGEVKVNCVFRALVSAGGYG